MVHLADHLLKLATFNIRYAPFSPSSYQVNQLRMSGNGEAPWASRLPFIIDQIEWEMPDIIGFQEALEHQYNDLRDQLASSHYDSVGVGRDDGARRGEFVPLFWRSDKFTSLSVKHFWLSDHPDVPGSIGWDAGQTRMVTLVHFQPLTSEDNQVQSANRSFYVMNTHFDDRGFKAKLILKRANELILETNLPIVLMGDFNAPSSEEAYEVLTGDETEPGCTVSTSTTMTTGDLRRFKDCRNEVARKYGASEATFTGFDGNPNVAQVIDYILTLTPDDKRWKTVNYGVIPNQFLPQQLRASDHRLVCALLDTTP